MAVNWQRTVLHAMGAREHPIEVTGVEDLLPWYRRVHITAPGFLRDRELFPTAWIRLWVPDPDNPATLRQRAYTLVDPDPEHETFSLEFVLHEPTGAAARWAQHAQPGDTAEISFTPARLLPDPGIGTFILVGDSSAIPAINSLLDYLPATAKARVLLADSHDDAEQLLRAHPGTVATRVQTGAELAGLLRDQDFDRTDCYVWAAGERMDVAAIRGLVRGAWKLPKDRQHTQYYWIHGKPFG